jgi:hypothetical protein
MENKKMVVGIEIDEILRSKWVQFDRYFVDEFGEELAPEDNPYCHESEFFEKYTWREKIEKTQELKEPEDMPENINPLDYITDETGKAEADYVIHKPEQRVTLTPREVYKRFLYEDFVFELFGSAPLMYRGMDLDVAEFIKKYSEDVEFVILSKENWFTTPPTLFFLSKIGTRFKSFRFVDEYDEMWKYVDVLITTNPVLVSNKPEEKKLIKLKRPYNTEVNDGLISGDIFHIKDLINNEDFERIINYTKKEDNGEN